MHSKYYTLIDLPDALENGKCCYCCWFSGLLGHSRLGFWGIGNIPFSPVWEILKIVLVLVSGNLLVWYWKDNRVHMEIYRLIHIQNIAYTDIHRHECIYIWMRVLYLHLSTTGTWSINRYLKAHHTLYKSVSLQRLLPKDLIATISGKRGLLSCLLPTPYWEDEKERGFMKRKLVKEYAELEG